ncbi:MAG: tetratricopeptide repeat protein [Rubrivivax sp.]|jgi:putative thioredoxin|nr:tetratricopeptide repeat protein [Rubrivivax sp.]
MNAFAPLPTGSSPHVVDVGEADFRESVIDRSFEVPVLLDCWAPWCGPCRSLGPILEKLAGEYQGRFVLAKLNTEESPQLAAALQIRSIPMVMLIVEGRPVDQFTGALPERQVREFLDRHLAAGAGVSEAEQLRQDAAAAETPQAAEALLRQALALEPRNLAVKFDLVERLVARGAVDDAVRWLDGIAEADRDDRYDALLKRVALARNRPAGDKSELAARVAAQPRDFDARLALAAILIYEGDFDAGFDQLLEIVLRDKGDWREKARAQLVEWFSACPDTEAVSRGRRYLGMYLN